MLLFLILCLPHLHYPVKSYFECMRIYAILHCGAVIKDHFPEEVKTVFRDLFFLNVSGVQLNCFLKQR